MPDNKTCHKVVSECEVIEREDGRWVLFVNGRPRMVLSAQLGRTRPANRDVSPVKAR